MYTLRVLSNSEFDKLPYKRAQTSLGLANAKTGMAFVRDTGYNDITKATISHELDELVNKVSPHEEDGIRYKSLASYGAGAGGGALASMIPALKPFAPLISAGAGALANRKGQPLQGALQGFTGGGAGSTLLSGGKAAIGGLTDAGGTFGKALSSFGSGAKQGAIDYGRAIPGFGVNATTGVKGKGAQLLDRFNIGGAPTGGGAAPSAGTTAVEGGVLNKDKDKKGFVQNILDQFGKAAPGILTAGAGELFAPKVSVPDFSGYGEDLQAKIQSGEIGEPIAKELGMAELKRVLGEDLGAVPSTAFELGDIENRAAKQEALTNYVNHFKSIRPGADFSNDPEFQRGYAEIEEQYDRVRAAQRDATSFQYTQQQLQQKYNYMVQALGIDQYQMQQYIQLAQLGVDELMAQFELDAGEAEAFRSMFGDLAQVVTQSQQPNMSLDLSSFLNTGGQ